MPHPVGTSVSVRARGGKAGLTVLATDLPSGCFPARWSSHRLSHWEVTRLKRSRHTSVPDTVSMRAALGHGRLRSQATGAAAHGLRAPARAPSRQRPGLTRQLLKGDEAKETHVLVRTGQGRGGKVVALHTHSLEESLTVSIIDNHSSDKRGRGGETGRKRALPAKTDGQGPH